MRGWKGREGEGENVTDSELARPPGRGTGHAPRSLCACYAADRPSLAGVFRELGIGTALRSSPALKFAHSLNNQSSYAVQHAVNCESTQYSGRVTNT